MPPRENIAIFLPNWVGDVVMATPASAALRRHFGSACITHVGRAAALATLSGTAWADRTLLETSTRPPVAAHFLAQVHRLRAARFGRAVLLPNSFRSALLARLAGIGRTAGYARGGRGWLLTHRLVPPRQADGRFLPISAVRYYLDLAEAIGAPGEPPRMELAVTPAEAHEAERVLADARVDLDRPIVMLNPGAAFGASKLWAAERFAALADMLVERHGAQIVVNAAPSERPIAARVVAAMRHPPAVSFAERDNTLGLLKALMRRCRLLVTNDTGARHVAAAMGIGVVTLFGSTDPRWSEIDYDRERIVRASVPCSPCQRKRCPQPPGLRHNQCMTAITPEAVLEACDDVLTRLDRRPGP